MAKVENGEQQLSQNRLNRFGLLKRSLSTPLDSLGRPYRDVIPCNSTPNLLRAILIDETLFLQWPSKAESSVAPSSSVQLGPAQDTGQDLNESGWAGS